MKSFEQDLEEAVKFHGHLCAGQILGVRMTRMALRKLGIEEPEKYKDLVVYVEADRCLADAVMVVAKCNMGRRRLKWIDYGKMAATFVDIAKNKAIRVGPKDVKVDVKQGEDLVKAWAAWSDEDAFSAVEVTVDIPAGDLPGNPIKTIVCSKCGEKVHDGRSVTVDGAELCRACANGAYYKIL
jgi:formylmethanofuran dehydrogenase subunit E